MGTEVLRPQDCLRLNQSVIPRRKPYYTGNSNPRSHRKPVIRSETKKCVTKVDDARSIKNEFVLGKVTILKRGESIDVKGKNESLDVCVPSQIRVKDLNSFRSEEVYAGSAFFSSPSPRKLPLPTFSKKNDSLKAIDDDSATKDLRRLLRLD